MVTAVPRVTVIGDVLLDRDWTAVANRLSPDGPVPVLDEPTEVARPG
jgi:D-beta-D-heptose 7-phosphate kinase / D-beta-D-heptose 1-phosphate adenosyltransferase